MQNHVSTPASMESAGISYTQNLPLPVVASLPYSIRKYEQKANLKDKITDYHVSHGGLVDE